ncbi:NACHT domain-containing protein, partial [Methylobacterium trifolii]|uniref:NACHT domain-containing protein n=1 Tax=Methylobacterium trifolii TaxID=1003092 RepID=UPI001EDE6D2D
IYTDLRYVEKLDDVESLIRYASPAIGEANLHHFTALLGGGSVVFVLDGLDEVEPARRSRLVELILRARKIWSECYFIVTSRVYDSQALLGGGFNFAIIKSLSPAEINQLTSNWAAIISVDKSRSGKDFSQAVDKLLAQERSDQRFIRSPLVLALLASIYIGTGNTPGNRVALFAQVVNWLLKSRSLIRESQNIDLKTTKLALESVAFSFVVGSISSRTTMDQAAAAAAKLASINQLDAEKALHIEAFGNNCLVVSDGKISFWHESIRDYFAAFWLFRKLYESPGSIPLEVEKILYDVRFREVADLLIALLATSDGDMLQVLFREKLPRGASSIENIRATSLLARILKTGKAQGAKFTSDDGKQIEDALRRYIDLTETNLLTMSIADRREMLRAAGSLKKDFRLYGPPGRRAVETASPRVKIGKFPVTVQEYGRFLNFTAAGGHAGSAMKWQADHLPVMWDTQQDTLNAPVSGVDWQQADAYCRWLTVQMRSEHKRWSKIVVRLPSCDEWRSMTGLAPVENRDLKRWSGPFVSRFLAPVDPVGVYPERASPYGHQDISDGIWEWIGPSLDVRIRRKQIVSSEIVGGLHITFVKRVRGVLASPLVGFRIVFEDAV